MLFNSHKYLIAYDEKKQENRYADYLVNSVKVSFNDSENIFEQKKNSDIKRCQQCKVVLHIRDSEWLYSIQDYKKAFESFHKDVRIAEYQGKTKNNDRDDRVWICRYCGKHQKLNIKNIFYMTKPLVIKLEEKKNLDTKAPIIIFLIDLSSSMGNSATQNQVPIKGSNKAQKDEQHMNKHLYQLIKGSKLALQAKKSQEQIAKKQMKKILQKYHQKIQYSKTINKSHLLMALIERAIQNMKSLNQKQKVKRKYGFIFFNNNIFLAGDCTKPNFPIAIMKQKNKEEKGAIDFTSFQDLFKFGSENSQNYENNLLQNFDSKNITLRTLKQQGQTALGPAIATALGIIEKHGSGSTIMAITDGYTNKGILSEEIVTKQQNNQNIQKIIQKLNQYKCKLGIIQWRKNGQIQYVKNEIDKLIQSTNLAVKYEANLKVNESKIQQYIQSINSLAFDGRIDTQITKMEFKHNVQFVSVSHLSKNQQQKKQISNKQLSTLINSKSSIWMKVHIDKQKVDQFYLNSQPIYTQLCTTVSKVDTQQIVQYICEIQQYLTDNSQMTTSNGLNAMNAQERIARYGIQGNSLNFNQQAMKSINNSIYNYNISHGGYSIGYMNDNSKYNFARENGLSFKALQEY